MLTWTMPSYAGIGISTQENTAFIRLARNIETAELGIPHPAGLVFSPAMNTFHVVSASATDQSLSSYINLTAITPFEESVGSISIPVMNPDPINMAFDGVNGRLLILQPDGQKAYTVPAGSNGRLKPAMFSYHNIKSWKLDCPRGIVVDQNSGQIFVLNSSGTRLVRIMPAANGALENAAVTEVDLKLLGLVESQGLAFDPLTGHLHLLSRTKLLLYELTQSGQIAAIRDLSSFGIIDPQAMVMAPSGDMTDDPQQMSLYLADSGLSKDGQTNHAATDGKESGTGQIVELSFVEPAALAESTFTSELIHIIDTSAFLPPSPDPAGLEIITSSNTLLISDSEVEETSIWSGVNLFETTLSGSLVNTSSTLAFTKEPTGIAYNPSNQHIFFSDDDKKKVFEINPGGDGLCGTKDDIRTYFSTSAFNSNDPEGLAYDSPSGSLWIVDGTNAEVYQVMPGDNGIFDGVSPGGDDLVTSFDTSWWGILDPEGICLNSATGNLYVVGRPANAVAEFTATGNLVQIIDISAAAPSKPAGMGCGLGSMNPAATVMYISDRGIDNDTDSTENDGKVYELSLPPVSANTSPLVVINSPTNGASYNLGTSITFSGTANDVQDGNLSAGLKWTSSRDGLIGSGASFNTTGLSAGSHTVTAAVTDRGGLTGSAQVSFVVNTPPVVSISSPVGGGTYPLKTSVTFSGTASDVQDGSLSAGLKWTSSRDGLLGNGASFITAGLSAGRHTVTATVTDSGDLTGAGQVTFLVADTPPVVNISSPVGGGTYPLKTSITFSAAASDLQDGNLSAGLKWTSSRDGLIGSGASFNTTGLSAGSHTVTAAVTDSGGLTGAAQVTFLVADTPPVVNISSPLDGGTYPLKISINFSAVASDLQDGNLSAGLKWTSSRDGLLGSGASFSTAGLSAGSHTVTAAVTDSGGLSGSAQVTFLVADTPPAVSISSPKDGFSCTLGTSITFSGTANDFQDGDLTAGLTWTSSRDGQIGSGATFSTSGLSAGTHTVTAAVTDSTGHTGSAQLTVQVTVITAFSPSDDALVSKATSTTNYGSAATLELIKSKDARNSYLKFTLSGLAGTVTNAKIRLYSVPKSSMGGSAYLVSNNYKGTTKPWTESGLIWKNAPTLPSTRLSTVGAVSANTWVEFDVTAAVKGNGTYSFALSTSSSSLTVYNSRQAGLNQPELVIETLND